MAFRCASLSASVSLLAAFAIGCSSSSDAAPPATAPTTTGDGGAPAPNDPDGPGITAKNCPGTPANLNLVKAAPVWGGLVVIEATVPGGVPGGIESQLLDPATNAWSSNYNYGVPRQKPDGTFAIVMSTSVRESSKGKEFKARMRAVLDGCPPSGWAETPGFTLSDPLAGTTWVAETPVGLLSSNFSVNHGGTGTAVGPYTASANVAVHTVTFNADNSFAETFAYTITSANNGDLYKDCKIQLTFAGTWRLDLYTGSPYLILSARKPKAGAASAGSTCTAPPVTDWAINQSGTTIELPAEVQYFNADYLGLLENPPGKATWDGNQLANDFNYTLQALNDTVGVDTASISGSVSPQQSRFFKQ